MRGLSGALENDASTLHTATGLVGPTVSGSFLFLIGILNLVILVSILGIFRRMRHGRVRRAGARGRAQTARAHEPLLRARDPGDPQAVADVPAGLLFGLGFDTATEVALLVLAGGAAAGGLPFYAILCLPILFAAGMSLFDTIDGAFMNFAYGWAFSKPVRKIFYNLTVTGLSVAVALGIGSIELLAVLAEKLSLTGGLWDVVTGLDLNSVGYIDRRPVRGDVGARARRLALRPHRAALERGRAAAVTTAPERRPLAFAGVERSSRRCARRGHRVSAPTSLVLEALFAADDPVSVEDLGEHGPRADVGLPQPRAAGGARRGQPRPRRPRPGPLRARARGRSRVPRSATAAAA